MFRFHKPQNIVTLFHKPNFAPSMRVLTLLKQASAEASETATGDQAGDHSHQNKAQHSEFDLEVSEQIPTTDQLRNILEYAGNDRIKDVVEGATSVSNALQKLSQDKKAFQFPVTVDWNNGKAVIGDDESEILKLVEALPKR